MNIETMMDSLSESGRLRGHSEMLGEIVTAIDAGSIVDMTSLRAFLEMRAAVAVRQNRDAMIRAGLTPLAESKSVS
jgi:hypothetical protein